ncbi:MAG: hypothetical protein RLO81_15245 [Fulvivirga sp.]|uniref:hypothetical protein n=1 Tax=Fulvivirga sp. TaxID=1931237 RepID=UPI0032EFF195
MKEARVYRGIEFIRISELPENQKEAIKSWATKDVVIKILIDDHLLSDCIQYKDYRVWFETVYQQAGEKQIVAKTVNTKSTSIKLALGGR